LGYPSRETLAAWIEELCPEIRKRIVGRAVDSVPKSQKVKQAAVIELRTREQSARVVAEKAGVSRPTLYNWKNQLLGREVPASMKRIKRSQRRTMSVRNWNNRSNRFDATSDSCSLSTIY
jgi:DNA invertase Pin-like site-specific DNA recombinase